MPSLILVLLLMAAGLAGCLDGAPEPLPEPAEPAVDRPYPAAPDLQSLSDEDTLRIAGDRSADRLARHLGWRGSGIPGDPYWIDGLELEGTTLIFQDLSRMVHLDQATLAGASGRPALILDNVTGFTLTHSALSATDAPALSILQSEWVRVENDTIVSNEDGLTVLASQVLDILDNRIESQGTAIRLADGGGGHWLDGNTVTSAANGIQILRERDPVSLQRNQVEAPRAVLVQESPAPLIAGNTFTGRAPLQIIDSPEALLRDNTLHAERTALTIRGSDGTYAEHTRITSGGTGIRIDDTESVLVEGVTYQGPGTAVDVQDASLVLLANLTLELTDDGNGIVVQRTGMPIVMDSRIEGAKNGITFAGTTEGLILHNQLYAVGTAIHLDRTTDTLIAENLIEMSENGTQAAGDQGLQIFDNTFRYLFRSAIHLEDTPGAEVAANQFTRATEAAVRADRARDLLLENNAISRGLVGFDLQESPGAAVQWNQFMGPGTAVQVTGPATETDLLIAENRILADWTAISLTGIDGFELRTNLVNANGTGLRVTDVTEGLVYDNYFENAYNVHARGTIGIDWQVAPRAGQNIVQGDMVAGNWWFDYHGPDLEGDGIGEIPHGVLPYEEEVDGLLVYTGSYGVRDESPLVKDEDALPQIPFRLQPVDPKAERLPDYEGRHPRIDRFLTAMG